MKPDKNKKKVRVQEIQYDTWQVIGRKVQRLIWLVSGLIQSVILLRVLFLLIGANPNNAFANLLYRFTDYLLTPFGNIVSNISFGNIVIDLTALIAVLVYSLATWLLTELVWVIFSTGSTKQKVVYEE